MPVDPVGASLASIALLFPIYDACNRIYKSWQVRASFGKDLEELYFSLEIQWVRLYLLMEKRQGLLLDPPDPDDKHQWVTRAILTQLAIIKLRFEECDQLVKKNCDGGRFMFNLQRSKLERREVRLTSKATLGDEGGSEIALTGSSSRPSMDAISGNPNDPSLNPTRQKRSERLRSFLHISKKEKTGIQTPSAGNSLMTSSQTNLSKPHSSRSALPIPELTHVHKIQVQNSETAQRFQQSSTFKRRIIWDHHDKENLQGLVSKLDDDITQLARILPEKSPNDPSALLALPAKESPNRWKTTAVQRALQRAHESLRKLNREIADSGSKATKLFSVYITETPETNWRILKQDSDLPLREDSLIFCIQMENIHKARRGEEVTSGSDESDMLLVETTKETPPNSTEATNSRNMVELASLDGPGTGIDLGSDDLYEVWGCVSTPTNAADRHQIFHEKTKWRRIRTLSDIIVDESFKEIITIDLMIALARRVIQAYLDFAIVRSSCTEMTLESFLLYKPVEENDARLDFQRLYLSIGFGCSLPRKRLGATDGLATDPNTSMIRLGLNLYELGSRTKIDLHPGVQGQRTILSARDEAKINLGRIERSYGPLFAQIVQICLEYRRPSPEDAEHELLTAEKFLDALGNFETALHTSVM